MAIVFSAWKRKPWTVNWKHSWTGRKVSKSFATEKEKNILKKAKKTKARVSRITVRELLDSYFSLAHNNMTTISTARYHVVPLVGAFGGRMASLLTVADILNFAESQRLRDIAQSTVNRRVSILRAALNWGVRNGLLSTNPLSDLRMPKASSRRSAPPTPQEANAIMAHAAPHVQRVIVLGLCIGARIGPSELFRLTWWNIDLGNAMIRLPSADKNQREDGRDIPIRRALLPILHEWRTHDLKHGVQHVVHWRGEPVRCISKSWHSALKRAGICRRIRPYDLRHAYATYSLAGGADIKTVAEIMGHTDASMILKTYQHVQDAQKRAAVEALPDFLELGKRKGKNIPGMAM